ncbi:MAG: glycosyltransferase [Bacteroidaceae bacterium]|nr:glycosyltransferase [Bacteroidaceae bacterium]
MPKITVGIPVYNAEKTIARAIQSVLNQTYTDFELIIIDDGSTDGTLQVIQSFNDPCIRLFHDTENKGIAFRLNQQISLAQGDYFARMDADDIMFPNRLERQLEVLEQHPEIDVLGSSVIVVDENCRILGYRGKIEKNGMTTVDSFSHPTVMGKLSWFRTNLYNEKYSGWEDYDLWLRTRNSSVFKCLDEPLLFYKDSLRYNTGQYAKRHLIGNKVLCEERRFFHNPFAAYWLMLVNLFKIVVVWLFHLVHLDALIIKRRNKSLSGDELQKYQVLLSKVLGMKHVSSGALVISLDYELMWGMIDVAEKDGYGQTNVKNVPEVIGRLLSLFDKYGIHATFATVGMIMYENKEDLLSDIPSVVPSYTDPGKSPYERNYIQDIKPEENTLFFQKEIIEEIKKHNNVEIGTHTYCHYYCWEEGQTVEQFDVDTEKALFVASKQGINIKSIVFPRNQCSKNHLAVCARHGMTSYRGNALKYFDQTRSRFQDLKSRICRLIDAYCNLGGSTAVSYSSIDMFEQPLNLRASRMLRPYSPRLSFLEGLRLKRIKKEMLCAAKNGQMYHLWWHPHNFGANMTENFAFLEEVCKYYQYLNQTYGFKSYTMTEMCKLLRDEE